MPSNYSATSSTFTDTIPLCVDSDQPRAQLFRVPVERVLDNTAYLKQIAHSAHLSLHRLSDSDAMPRCLALGSTDLGGYPFTLVFRGETNTVAAVYLPAEQIAYDNGASVTSTLFRGIAAQNADLSGRILAVSAGASPVHYSDNQGDTWTSVSQGNSFAFNAEDVAHNGTLWIALPAGASTCRVYTSPTGASGTWTVRTLDGATNEQPKRIASSRTTGRSIVSGTDSGGTVPFMFQSADGVTWSRVTLPVGVDGVKQDVRWHSDGYFFWLCTTTGPASRLYRSPDVGAVSWTRVDDGSLPGLMHELAIDQTVGTVYACGRPSSGIGTLAMSKDLGASWVTVPSQVTHVAAANGVLFARDIDDDTLYGSSPLTLGHV